MVCTVQLENALCQIDTGNSNFGRILLPSVMALTLTTMAHYDAVGRGHPSHQQSHAGLQTLCHNPRLQIIRPASVSPPRLDHLETPNKPITTICHTKSPFVSGDFLADTSSVRNPHNQWGEDGAYDDAQMKGGSLPE